MPDGSSADISPVTRFDYADETYVKIACDAYLKWSKSPKYEDIFESCTFVLRNDNVSETGTTYLEKTTQALTKLKLPWTKLKDCAAAKRLHPILSDRRARTVVFLGTKTSKRGGRMQPRLSHSFVTNVLSLESALFVVGQVLWLVLMLIQLAESRPYKR